MINLNELEGEQKMKIAIATDNDQVSPHFGHCVCYTIFDVEDTASGKKIINRSQLDTPEHEPCTLPGILHQKGVDVVIAGGMGARAQQLFTALDIQNYIGVTGKIDDVINDFLAGKLQSGESLCDHGDSSHHDCHHH